MTITWRVAAFAGRLRVDPAADRRSWGILVGRRLAKTPVDRAAGMEIAQNAIPTPGLDGAQTAPPTTAHKAHLSLIDEKKKTVK